MSLSVQAEAEPRRAVATVRRDVKRIVLRYYYYLKGDDAMPPTCLRFYIFVNESQCSAIMREGNGMLRNRNMIGCRGTKNSDSVKKS